MIQFTSFRELIEATVEARAPTGWSLKVAAAFRVHDVVFDIS
jgi:hypothetical protein